MATEPASVDLIGVASIQALYDLMDGDLHDLYPVLVGPEMRRLRVEDVPSSLLLLHSGDPAIFQLLLSLPGQSLVLQHLGLPLHPFCFIQFLGLIVLHTMIVAEVVTERLSILQCSRAPFAILRGT